MKKLKLNKQTVSLLGNDGQKNIVGGGNTYQNTCPVTQHAPCQSYTCGTRGYGTVNICDDFPV